MKGIKDQHDMFALAFEKLDEATKKQVDDLAEMRPRLRDEFKQLRHRVITSYALSKEVRMEQLLAVPALGGQCPSTLLVHMRQLCLSSEVDGLIFRWLFQQRLPLHIRLHLKEDSQSPVSQLAGRADLLMADVSPHSGITAVVAPGQQLELKNQGALVAAV